MKCENLQFNLSVYLDDCLVEDERALVDRHLAQCPLCRQKLADFQALRAGLRGLSRPELPVDVLTAMRSRVARAAESSQPMFSFLQTETFREWLQMRLMPYTVGTAASMILGLTLLWTLLSAAYIPERSGEIAKLESPTKSIVLLSDTNPRRRVATEGAFELDASDYASGRLSVSGDSPSLNPQGALVALTNAIVRGNMKDDEVVIIADVFGDGLAQIAEVVEPSSDIRAVGELEKALKYDPNFAPFVPASFDKRSETVRVIFKINRVDIKTNIKPKSKSK